LMNVAAISLGGRNMCASRNVIAAPVKIPIYTPNSYADMCVTTIK